MKALAVLVALAAPSLAQAQDLSAYMTGVPACLEAETPSVCIGDGAEACMDTEKDGQSTVGMMFCLQAEAQAWDVALNDEYARALAFAEGADAEERPHFPEFAVRFDQVKAAQRAWIAFRDANCDMAYGIWGSGSMRMIEGASCLLQMTARRTVELRDYRLRMVSE